MTLVVDASVALKWSAPEAGSPEALALFNRGEAILAPDLVISEVANALWKKVGRGEMNAAQAKAALAATARGYSALTPASGLAERALDLAMRFKHPAYDCFFLALAEARDATFVTADTRLLALLAQGGWAGKCEAL